MAKQYKTMGELLDELEKEGAEIPNICLVLRAPTETELEKVGMIFFLSVPVFLLLSQLCNLFQYRLESTQEL